MPFTVLAAVLDLGLAEVEVEQAHLVLTDEGEQLRLLLADLDLEVLDLEPPLALELQTALVVDLAGQVLRQLRGP